MKAILHPLSSILFAALLTGCATAPLTHGIPNLRQVEPGVWRGGQPTAEGWTYLASLGVTEDVKLNLENGGDPEATALGMTVHSFPLSFARQIGLREIPRAEFYTLIDSQPPTRNVFIHCQHGEDRTGVAVALWRMRQDNWTKPMAEKEMLKFGFHKSLFGLWRFWKTTTKE